MVMNVRVKLETNNDELGKLIAKVNSLKEELDKTLDEIREFNFEIKVS